MSTLLFTYMEATGSFSGIVLFPPLRVDLNFSSRVFNVDAFLSQSKEESGFMAVPLIDKGVVVVAVGYDIAPKGRVFCFRQCCRARRLCEDDFNLQHVPPSLLFRQHGSNGVSSTQKCCFCCTAVFSYQVNKFFFPLAIILEFYFSKL